MWRCGGLVCGGVAGWCVVVMVVWRYGGAVCGGVVDLLSLCCVLRGDGVSTDPPR